MCKASKLTGMKLTDLSTQEAETLERALHTYIRHLEQYPGELIGDNDTAEKEERTAFELLATLIKTHQEAEISYE